MMNSDTQVTATVPTGATMLTSNQKFHVTPTITSFSPLAGMGSARNNTGTGLTQTTKVAFNNKVATLTVNSDTQATATVPPAQPPRKLKQSPWKENPKGVPALQSISSHLDGPMRRACARSTLSARAGLALASRLAPDAGQTLPAGPHHIFDEMVFPF
jgi:hypothetical protein